MDITERYPFETGLDKKDFERQKEEHLKDIQFYVDTWSKSSRNASYAIGILTDYLLLIEEANGMLEGAGGFLKSEDNEPLARVLTNTFESARTIPDEVKDGIKKTEIMYRDYTRYYDTQLERRNDLMAYTYDDYLES